MLDGVGPDIWLVSNTTVENTGKISTGTYSYSD